MIAIAKQNLWIDEPVQVQRGDIWQLGNHRLMCGDSTNAEDVARLFQGEQFSLCFTSPPYSDQRTYKLGSFDWHSLMCGAFDRMVEHGLPDCHILINLGLSHKNRQVDMYWLQWLMYCASVGWPLFGWYVWDKGPAMPGYWGGRLAPSHEFIFHFTKASTINKWIPTQQKENDHFSKREEDGFFKQSNNPAIFGQPFKVPDSVLRITREKTRGLHSEHPAVFPVALPEFIMHTWSQSGDIVYEPFCGSGTSIIAGENLNRRVYACEIEPSYCELAIRRWQEMTGRSVHRVQVCR